MSRHPRRLPPLDLGSNPVFLTICTWQRCCWFECEEIVRLVERLFLQTCQSADVQIPAYCFMPDHVHALVDSLSAGSDVNQLVKTVKQVTAFHMKRTHGLRLWQSSFFDRSLRVDESVPSVIAYIVNNPIRAGLVDAIEKYPYWGSQVYERDEILEFVRCAPDLKVQGSFG